MRLYGDQDGCSVGNALTILESGSVGTDRTTGKMGTRTFLTEYGTGHAATLRRVEVAVTDNTISFIAISAVGYRLFGSLTRAICRNIHSTLAILTIPIA